LATNSNFWAILSSWPCQDDEHVGPEESSPEAR
jgi:hypothetical protein